ncbi:MAG: TadE/TadG family type IV pilus assembly protein [Nocardioides sp.]
MALSIRRSETGSASLEFGLVAPVIFLLIFGIIQYGYLFWALQTSAATAREAARSLIVGTQEDCTLARAVDMAAGPAVGGGTPSATATYHDPAGAVVAEPVEGGLVEVAVSFDTLDMNLPFLPLPDGGHVTQRAEARVENVPPVPLACG